IVAIVIGTSPLVLLSGIGAMAAVFSFIFKDTILSLVAGVLLSVNDMLRIGDWIEMPAYGANGDVVEITMNTVKVKNFDLTITTIPAYALISDSFKNWRGIIESGGRRIMRSVSIDLDSIKICDDEMHERFQSIPELKDLIEKDKSLTNLAVFRIYLDEYLKRHPMIHQNIIQIVRQLPPTTQGVPLEVYAFSKDLDWVNYEGLQAEIFEHIFAVISDFDLRIFQEPSAEALRKVADARYS
ncbi:MAG TPA: mechanosensitive ion channel protein MscS, partial [Eubacteriaceae bacterium]|nr:mechanosensitive ion channel protein MscS [Eubacteriaceae bacterium]